MYFYNKQGTYTQMAVTDVHPSNYNVRQFKCNLNTSWAIKQMLAEIYFSPNQTKPKLWFKNG